MDRTLTPEEIAAAAYQAGFRGPDIATAVAIALAESSGRPRAHNDRAPDDSYGLWQINMIGNLGPARRDRLGLSSNQELFDPVANAKAAFEISGGGTNWRPWTTFTSGAYRQHLPVARAAAASDLPSIKIPSPGDLIDWLPSPGDAVDAVGGALAEAVGAAVEPFVTGLRRLTVIGVTVAAGVALVVLGAWRGMKAAASG